MVEQLLWVMFGIVAFAIVNWIIAPQFSWMRKRGHDAEVKSNLRNAATSQEAYFVDNRTYTKKISSLRGFKQSANVNITMEATKTTFVITGSTIKGCKTNTGTLTYNSIDRSFSGTPCSRVDIFSRLFGGN